MNLKLCGIAAALGFALSLLVGTLSGGALDFSLIRALIFGIVFFVLAALSWLFINRFLPELLAPPSEEPLMAGLEAGSRVNISLGDDEAPVNAAVPSEEDARGKPGTVEELMAGRTPPRNEAPDAAPEALDLGAEAGYSKGGILEPPGEEKQNGMPGGPGPAAPAEESGAAFTPLPPPPPLQSFSGAASESGIETLPDLDAMAGAFMSSNEEEGEETAPPSVFGVEAKPRGSGKAKSREDDYNPKEVASAIQTILKRD